MGRPVKISERASAVQNLFMAFEEEAKRKKLDKCWFCGEPWTRSKSAYQGTTCGNHLDGCPFENLAAALEQCVSVHG